MATERELNPHERKGTNRCPDCGRQVEPVITGRRHTMGTWIPVWGPGPCRDPECPSHTRAATEDA